jgi:hypothetical protein
MTAKTAIATILAAAAALLVFSTLVFNREMVVMVESNETMAATESLPAMAEAFSAKMDTMGVNPAVDALRREWKLFLGMSEE